jgi:hypothetical protein
VGVIVLFMAALALYAGWWLSHQRLMAKPWLEEGVIGEFPGGDRLSAPPATIGLGVFLAVAGSLFALVMSAYVVRMQLLDWRPLPVPPLLWFNTGVLVLSSVILQWAQAAARRGDFARRSRGARPDHRQTVARRRLAEIAPERGIVRPVLALPAPGLADASGASDRLDTRLPRFLWSPGSVLNPRTPPFRFIRRAIFRDFRHKVAGCHLLARIDQIVRSLIEKARYRYRALHCLLGAPVGFQKPMPPPATYASELVENNGVPGRTRSANDFQRSPDESGLTNPGIN